MSLAEEGKLRRIVVAAALLALPICVVTGKTATPSNPAVRTADSDTGAALEECIFGGLVGHSGNVYIP